MLDSDWRVHMVQIAGAIMEPLAPQVLRAAGVPLDDALWYSRLTSPRSKALALVTPRGERLLGHVREFMHRSNAHQAMPMTS